VVNTPSALVRAANRWRSQYNPLRGLTIQRAVSLLEAAEDGRYADAQWTFQLAEKRWPVLAALVERRLGAIGKLDWNIKTVGDAGRARPPGAPLGNRAVLRNEEEGHPFRGNQWTGGIGGGEGDEPPPRISAERADALLMAGFTEKSAAGKEVRFGQRLKTKLESQPGYEGRKELLEWGREAVRSGVYTQQTVAGQARDYYAKVFRSGDRGILVIVDAKDGEAFNLFQSDLRYLSKKGYFHRRAGEPRQGEQPPSGVLQALAAAGCLPDWNQYSGGAALVNLQRAQGAGR
jgi:hypothetical protein